MLKAYARYIVPFVQHYRCAKSKQQKHSQQQRADCGNYPICFCKSFKYFCYAFVLSFCFSLRRNYCFFLRVIISAIGAKLFTLHSLFSAYGTLLQFISFRAALGTKLPFEFLTAILANHKPSDNRSDYTNRLFYNITDDIISFLYRNGQDFYL